MVEVSKNDENPRFEGSEDAQSEGRVIGWVHYYPGGPTGSCLVRREGVILEGERQFYFSDEEDKQAIFPTQEDAFAAYVEATGEPVYFYPEHYRIIINPEDDA